jgi:hypothetical protein
VIIGRIPAALLKPSAVWSFKKQSANTPRSAARLLSYDRLDLTVAYGITLLYSIRSYVGLNIINVCNRQNVFYFERTTGNRVNLLGFFPYVL